MESQYQPSPDAERDGLLQLVERLAWLGRTDIPTADLRSAWTHLEQLLSERVGTRLSAGISQAELNEFQALSDDTDYDENGEDAGARWLRLHVPDYRPIVDREIAALTQRAAAWFDAHYPTNTKEQQDDQAA